MNAASYAWSRFWTLRTGVVDLSDGGFLVDPAQASLRPGTARPAALQELRKFRALGLLGEPGMGKSTALRAESAQSQKVSCEERVFSLHVDLRDFSSEVRLCQKLFESQEVAAWKFGTSTLILHLDSLDEALIRINSVANLLATELRNLPTERLYIRIACRTAVWPEQTLEPAFKEIWGDDGVGIFELCPLRRADIIVAAKARAVDPHAFIEQLYITNVVPFAIKPLTLNMLLGLFESGGGLPRSIIDLYTRGCRKLCEEQNPSRRDTRNLGQLNLDQRLRLAGRIAAVSLLANRYAIWTGPESETIPDTDVPLSKLSTGMEEGDFQSFDVDEAKSREVLDTGLFSARGVSRMGWAHQSYCEFLAAHYLIAKGVCRGNVLKLFVHPSGGLVPQLSTVAAWAASLDSEIRRELIAQEPQALLKGDLLQWSEDDLARLTEAILEAYDRQRVHEMIPGMANAYARLSHPGLAMQLQVYIADNTRGLQARRTACLIAETCELLVLQPELLRLALDVSEDASLRARAVSALGKCGDDSIADKLLPLAKGECGPDPINDIRGNALEILWPKHIPAEELFSIIVQPDEGYFGAYAMFLMEHLPAAMSTADLAPALRWATAFIETTTANEFDFQRKWLADAILVQAWKQFEVPDLTQPFVTHVFSRIANGGELFRGTDTRRQDAFFSDLDSDVQRRRAFILAASTRKSGKIEAYWLMRARLLRASDFDWLISICPSGTIPINSVDEETLCNMVESVFNWNDQTQFESLFTMANQWEPLRQRYIGLLEGVCLDSVEVKQAIETHRQMRELERGRRPPIEPPPAERVKDCLARYETGQLDAWWHLNMELTLSPQSTHYRGDHEFIITEMFGWRFAAEEIRARIVAAAENYLKMAEPFVSNWIGTGSFQRADYAAYRALILLRETRREIYDRLAIDLWKKWAPVVVAVDRVTGPDEAKLHDDIAAEASAAAPVEFSETVRTLIRSERAKTDKGAVAIQRLPPFLMLRRLGKCWKCPVLKAIVFSELQDPENSPEQFQALLEPLLAAGLEPAREYAIGVLADTRQERREYVVAAATGLAAFCADRAWKYIWSIVIKGEDIAEALFFRLAGLGRFRGASAFYEGLPESALGELYLWLERKFPYNEDRRGGSGMPNWVGPRERVADLRDGVLQHIIELGTDAGLKTLRGIIAKCGDLPWLALQLSRAEQIMRTKTWMPLTPSEIQRLATSRRGRLVQSPEDLCEVLIGALQKYEQELHGEQTPVQFLWARQTGGKVVPVDENAISDHVKMFLKRELVGSGIVLNREVEVGRVPGAPVGSRTDIKVDAIRRRENGEASDVIVAVIETKGCWNPELFTAIKSQLCDDYLRRLGASFGIYLVGWFDQAKWDEADNRKRRAASRELDEVQRQLAEKIDELAGDYFIRAVVLDCHAH